MFKLNLGSLPPKSTTPSSSEPSSSASTPVDEQQQQAPITSRIDSSSTDTILRLNMTSLSQLRNGKLTDQHYQNNNDNDPIDDDDDNDDDEQHEESGGDNEDEIRTTLMPKLQLNLSSMKLSNASIAAAASSATTTAMVDEETLSNSNNNNSDNNQVKTNNKRIVTVDLIVPQFCKCVVESSDSTNEYNQVKQHIENKWLKTQQRSNEQNQNCNTTTTTNDVDDDKKSIKPNISLYKIQSIDANNNNSSVDDENLACSLTLPIIRDTTNGDTSDLNPQQLSIFTVSSLNELIAQNQSLTIKYQKAMSALMEYSTQNQSLKQELSQNKKQIEELNRTRLEMRTLVDSLMHQHQLLAQSMLSTSAASHHQHPTASEPMVKTIPVPQPSKKNRKKKRTIKRKEQQKAAQQQQQQPQQQQSSQNKNKK